VLEPVAPVEEPLSSQLTLQAESLGVTENGVMVAPLAATLVVVLEGEAASREQPTATVTFHPQLVTS
jgi:hypothetical protein